MLMRPDSSKGQRGPNAEECAMSPRNTQDMAHPLRSALVREEKGRARLKLGEIQTRRFRYFLFQSKEKARALA